MGMTAVEKILARASGRAEASPGDLVWVNVDVAVMNDLGGPRLVEPHLQRLGAGVWDPERVVVVTDHLMPPVDIATAEAVQATREWARRYGIRHFYDGEGIAHTLIIEDGEALPGTVHIGGDSHTCTVGAVGAFAAGVGQTEIMGVLVTGQIWLRVPATSRIEWEGNLPDGVAAKDMALKVVGDIGPGGANYQAVEWTGSAVRALSIEERSVLTNMSAEVSAKTAFIEPDETTFAYLRERGHRDDFDPVYSDPDAAFAARMRYDASSLEPQVALPHAVENVVAVGQTAGVPIDQAYVGACTGAKYEDLQMVARILRGRKVAPNVRLLVAPASRRALRRAAATGVLDDLLEAGASLLATGCQACPGLGAGILAPGERCISTTNRNFKGRMGSPAAEIYLASPYTVAASAVAGRIADPRALL